MAFYTFPHCRGSSTLHRTDHLHGHWKTCIVSFTSAQHWNSTTPKLCITSSTGTFSMCYLIFSLGAFAVGGSDSDSLPGCYKQAEVKPKAVFFRILRVRVRAISSLHFVEMKTVTSRVAGRECFPPYYPANFIISRMNRFFGCLGSIPPVS